MKSLQFHYHMDIIFSEPVWNHTYTLKCVPQTTAAQEITECSIEISPENKVRRGRDSFGNEMLYGNVEGEHRIFLVDVRGRANVLNGFSADGIAGKYLPQQAEETAIYKYQTPLTRPGEAIRGLLERCRAELGAATKSGIAAVPGTVTESGIAAALRERVRFYMNRVHESMQYTKGVTGIDTTAEEALLMGKGVCQDYSHILLALCREDKIPARYVVGMLLGEGESHAWVEVFDGVGWIGFDPTNNLVVEDSHIKISHGRDYRDCSINRGVFTGQAQQKQRILVEVTEEET